MAVIRRRGEEPEGPEPTTYLGLQVSAPADMAGQRPTVTGAGGLPTMLPLPIPEWCRDPVGQEPPLGYSIAEVGAALGGASEPLHSTDTAVAKAPVQGSAEDNADA
jgi:hypothetical protein